MTPDYIKGLIVGAVLAIIIGWFWDAAMLSLKDAPDDPPDLPPHHGWRKK